MCDDALLEDGGAGNNWVTRFSIFRHNIRSVFCRVVRVFSEAGRMLAGSVLRSRKPLGRSGFSSCRCRATCQLLCARKNVSGRLHPGRKIEFEPCK